MYEIFEKLCEKNGITPYRFGKDMHVNSSTISTWKKKNSLAGPELAQKVCDYFGITIDFLMGKTDTIKCEICGMNYNPLWDEDWESHEHSHRIYLRTKELYPFFMNYSDAYDTRSNSIDTFRNPNKSMDERLNAFDDYLKSAFSLEISKCNYDVEHLDYEQFCKVEVSTLEEDWVISREFIEQLAEKYGIDRDFLNGNEQILARISNNPQMMRILAYAEKLNPGMLDALEVQVKAWTDNNTKG